MKLVRKQIMMSEWLVPIIEDLCERLNMSQSEFTRVCIMDWVYKRKDNPKVKLKPGQKYLADDYEYSYRKAIENG